MMMILSCFKISTVPVIWPLLSHAACLLAVWTVKKHHCFFFFSLAHRSCAKAWCECSYKILLITLKPATEKACQRHSKIVLGNLDMLLRSGTYNDYRVSPYALRVFQNRLPSHRPHKRSVLEVAKTPHPDALCEVKCLKGEVQQSV